MNNIIFLGTLIIGILGFWGCTNAPEESNNNQDQKPNILFITADDLGFQVGSYGDSLARTPNLDQLAEEGLKFTNGYITQASCSPARSSMFTGLYPHQNGQVGLSHRGFSMLRDIPNFYSFFNNHGYRTGIIGKLHVQPEEDYPFDYQPDINTRDVKQVAEGANTFINQGDQPFLLSVNYSDPHKQFDAEGLFPTQVKGIPENPHSPEDVKAFDFQQIDDQAQLEHIAGYYNSVARLDVGLGALMDVFEDAGLMQNTVIVFLGDHGPPFTRGKLGNYESSVNVPFIIKYAGKTTAGTVSESLISSIDIFPTLLDLAGFSPDIDMEGKSLTPVLSDPDHEVRDYLFTEFTYHTQFTYFPRRAVRGDRFKLIHNLKHEEADPLLSTDGDKAFEYSQRDKYSGTKVREAFERMANPPEFELYDLQKDPHEYHNIAGNPDHQEKLNELKKTLFKWRKNTHDPLLYPYVRESVESFEQGDRVDFDS